MHTGCLYSVDDNSSLFWLQIDSTDTQFGQPLREYILYTEAIKSVLRRRDAIQMEYEMTLEELKRKKAEKTQVATNITLFILLLQTQEVRNGDGYRLRTHRVLHHRKKTLRLICYSPFLQCRKIVLMTLNKVTLLLFMCAHARCNVCALTSKSCNF